MRPARIVSNLLTNASRYRPSGARIDIRAGVVDGRLAIDVSDNGMGIPAELLPRIFEPFVQGERKTHGSVGDIGGRPCHSRYRASRDERLPAGPPDAGKRRQRRCA